MTGQGIILHLGKKKASYQSYSELLQSDKPSIGDMVKFLEWKSTVEWNGTADEKIFPLLAAANLLSCVIYPTVKGSKAFPEMKNALLLRHTGEENALAVTLKTTVVFNLLSVLVATVKKRIEEMKKKWWKKKKEKRLKA